MERQTTPNEEHENECPMCGKPMERDDYCSLDCWRASLL